MTYSHSRLCVYYCQRLSSSQWLKLNVWNIWNLKHRDFYWLILMSVKQNLSGLDDVYFHSRQLCIKRNDTFIGHFIRCPSFASRSANSCTSKIRISCPITLKRCSTGFTSGTDFDLQETSLSLFELCVLSCWKQWSEDGYTAINLR